jgi:hypothetical protein
MLNEPAHATLRFRYTDMSSYTPPPTRKKPTGVDTSLCDFVDEYSVDDGIPQVDDDEMKQEYLHDGEQMTITRQTDIDLTGQVETRQSTSGFVLYLDGALVRYTGGDAPRGSLCHRRQLLNAWQWQGGIQRVNL